MTKQDLVNSIALQTGLTKKDSQLALETFIEVVSETLENGEDVSLSGFGKFEVVERAARTGTHPKTLAKLEIPASNVPKFRPSKLLKDAVK